MHYLSSIELDPEFFLLLYRRTLICTTWTHRVGGQFTDSSNGLRNTKKYVSTAYEMPAQPKMLPSAPQISMQLLKN